MPRQRIRRIDIKPYLVKAALASEVNGRVIMETVRDEIRMRITAGEHLHLRADDAEECLYPNAQCWDGLRDLRNLQVNGFSL